MGLFDRLFRKRDPLEPTSELMDEDLYWSIIDNSLKKTANQDEQEPSLVEELSNLSPKQIIGFQLRTIRFLIDLYTSDVWCAAYIMNGGCSDDGFEYFRCWVISRGRDVYNKAKENPDNLISEVNGASDSYSFEGFLYVALDAFKSKTGEDAHDYINDEKFATNEGYYPHMNFTWQEENPESMRKICPRLFDRLWDQ